MMWPTYGQLVKFARLHSQLRVELRTTRTLYFCVTTPKHAPDGNVDRTLSQYAISHFVKYVSSWANGTKF